MATTTHLTRARPQGAAGSPYSRTLHEITSQKLEELDKKLTRFENHKEALSRKTDTLQDPIDILEAWSYGVKQCFDIPVDGNGRVAKSHSSESSLEIDLVNIDRFLEQARYDPSISPRIHQQWQQRLQRHVDVQSLKYRYARLYGRLTNEMLVFQSTASAATATADPKASEVEGEDFEHVTVSRRLDERHQWEQQVFQSAPVSSADIDQLLAASFDPSGEEQKPLRDALESVRRDIRASQDEFVTDLSFDEDSLGWVIRDLLGSDLLTNEQREVLRDFESNPVILGEIADVLNMWISVPEDWSWGNEVVLEERRSIDGSSRIFMNQDLLQAIFLHFIGMTWSVSMKQILRRNYAYGEGVWAQKSPRIPMEARKRREYFLGSAVSQEQSVAKKRRDLYLQKYLLNLLPNSVYESRHSKEGDEEANFEEYASPQVGAMDAFKPRDRQTPATQSRGPQAPRKQVTGRTKQTARKQTSQAMRHRRIVFDEDEDDDDNEVSDSDEENTPMNAKQTLLHLLSTEILVKTRLHGEITCFRSQFDELFPSLPHETILRTLKFFGFSPRWLKFFQNFLQPPLRFADEPQVPPRVRQRGVPGSTQLSEMFSEVILFALDFQVNQVTGGEPLWRMHDDFWFWSVKESTCEAAWKTIVSFSTTMGLTLNPMRTGCNRIRQSRRQGAPIYDSLDPSKGLPSGEIRWGMLLLNPQNGKFEIDNKIVDKHVEELSRQLKEKSGSVFAWIQAWNTYATTFFTSNFGKPANCFGREHIDNMLATHGRIQRKIFSTLVGASAQSSGGGVVEFLKQIIAQRFDVTDIPDGYFFFPVELGGLDLQSPFITLLQLRETVVHNPAERLDAFEIAERTAFTQAKEKYLRGEVSPSSSLNDSRYQPDKPDEFLSFEEFTRFREDVQYSSLTPSLYDVYCQLLNRPSSQPIKSESNGPVVMALRGLQDRQILHRVLPQWNTMEHYWKWVVQLYGPEMIEHFGGLRIVDPGLLPIGMVGLFRSGRVSWQE